MAENASIKFIKKKKKKKNYIVVCSKKFVYNLNEAITADTPEEESDS